MICFMPVFVVQLWKGRIVQQPGHLLLPVSLKPLSLPILPVTIFVRPLHLTVHQPFGSRSAASAPKKTASDFVGVEPP